MTVIQRFSVVALMSLVAILPARALAESEEYYDELEKKCAKDDGCCEASVRRMRETDSILKVEQACPSGYSPEMMRCVTSLVWCEPKARGVETPRRDSH
jgi:hypothetical protein